MDLAYIDQLANNGDGYLHRASVLAKILLTGSIIAAVIVSDGLADMVFVLLSLVVLHFFNRMPLRKILHLALYPAFFSLMFALIRFNYSTEAGIIVILKAINAALAMILLITTTPYARVFSFFRLFMPGVLVDGMFFTYRIFFILTERMGNALKVIKIRGGLKPSNILFNIRNLSGVIGIIFIDAFALGERMYQIYSLRGYEGQLHEDGGWYRPSRFDYVPIAAGLIILTVVIAF